MRKQRSIERRRKDWIIEGIDDTYVSNKELKGWKGWKYVKGEEKDRTNLGMRNEGHIWRGRRTVEILSGWGKVEIARGWGEVEIVRGCDKVEILRKC